MTYPQMDPRRLDLTGTFGLRVANRDAAEVRIGTAGRWGQRVNLATNPSFEATSGTVVVRTNLATSPKSYTPATSGPHPGLGAGPYTGSAEIDGVRQAIDPLALVGGTTYVRLLIESGSVPLGDYFDGDESPDPDLTPAWTGAANASTSVLRGALVVGKNNEKARDVRTFASSQHATVGQRSRRIMWLTTYDGGWIDLDTITVPLGGVARVSLEVWLPEGVTVGYKGNSVDIPAGRAGAGRFTATGLVTGSTPRLTLSSPQPFTPSVSAWIDSYLIEDVTDLAAQWSALPDPKPTLDAWLDERLGSAYFDGDTPDTPAALHHWTATPHASTSVQTLAWTPGD